MAIAFFDLDRTLLAVNSAKLWLRREMRAGNLSLVDAARGAAWMGLYHLGFGNIERAIDSAVATLHGVPEERVRARTSAFFHDEVKLHLRPGAADAIAAQRAKGRRIILLTSSSSYLSEDVCQLLSLDGFSANRFEVDVHGHFTGKVLRPLCYGPGKREHAEEHARKWGVGLEECAFFTDSYSDLSVLEVVGEPVVVHPDPRLRREARRRGWPIVSWDA
ncbi:MAG: HAD family hydrolase [Myxococcota bacterium]